MPGVKTLADGNVTVILLAAKPVDMNAIKLSEATGGTVKNLSPLILFSDFDLGPTGSDTIDDKACTAKGNAKSYGPSNYGGGFSTFRMIDPTSKQADVATDIAFEAAKLKGTTLYLIVRENGKDATEAITTGDEYNYYEVITDDPKRGDRTGFIKYRHDCAVQTAAIAKKIVAS